MIGKTVSHYRILEKLGEGGMGVVYKAEDTKLKRIVALKFLPPELTRAHDAKVRFIHEAQAASALQHNNICTIHEIDETPGGQLFMSMDCYDGETLKQKISNGPLPLEEALDLAIQMADGLSKAHASGMVHRDIKPANIMVTSDGVAKILDFGVAKLAGQTKVTRTGMTVGTVAYMSPEQARGEAADARSDIFSLGAVLYEMLTGRLPFLGEHEAAVMYGIVNSEPKPLTAYLSEVPHDLQLLMDKVLKKDPRGRHQGVLQLRDELRAVSQGAAGSGERSGRPAMQVGGEGRHSGPVSGPVPSPAKTSYALAVMDFRDLATPDDPTVSAGITELISIALIEASPVRMISSEYIRDLRRRLFGSARGPIEEDQTMEVARQAGATLFLSGRIGKLGESQFVTWRLVDARTGESVGARRVDGGKVMELADRIVADVLPLVARATGAEARKAPVPVQNVTTESTRAYQHYMAGLLAREEGRADDAIAEFERAVAQDPDFALAYLELGRAHWGVLGYRDTQAANRDFEKAWALRSRLSDKDQMRLEAQRHDLGNRVGDSIAVLREIRRRWPDDRQASIDLEQGLFWRWYFAEVVDVDEEAQRLYPDDTVIGTVVYFGALASLGRSEDALRATKSYLERHPREVRAWDELGERYLEMGRTEDAETAFRKATELYPAWPHAAENLSYCAYQRGDVRGAVAYLERALEQKDLSANRRRYLICEGDFLLHLAALHVEQGRFGKAWELNAEFMGKLDAYVCGLLLEMGRAQEVLGMLERCGDEDPTLSQLYGVPLRGRALAQLGDKAGAEAVAKELEESEFDRGGRARFMALRIRTEIALLNGDPETALELLRKIEKNGSSRPFGGYINMGCRTALARAYRMAGRFDDAVKVHEEMLRLYGGHALSRYGLGQIYEDIKRPADAKKEYAKFLEMWSEADEGLPQLTDARTRLAAL